MGTIPVVRGVGAIIRRAGPESPATISGSVDNITVGEATGLSLLSTERILHSS